MKKLFILIIVCCPCLLYAQRYPALADTLSVMVIADQKAAGLPPVGMKFDSPEWLALKDSTFSSHHERLEKIFLQYGFPGYTEVGKQGSNHFWLLVQHLDKWPSFQEKVLRAMQEQVKRNNASGNDFAYLTDRVRVNTSRKQLYGTQVDYNTDSCQAFPKPLEDPAKVNQRRKELGMGSIEEYLNQVGNMHFLMNQAMYEGKGIKSAKPYKEGEFGKPIK